MGSEYATGEGSSFARAGKEPGVNGGLGSNKGRQGMAKAAVDTVRARIGEAGELLGFSSSSRIRDQF